MCSISKFYFSAANYSCLVDPTTINTYINLIWNLTDTLKYEPVTECEYSGSIHYNICSTSTTEPLCDNSYFAIYSYTGMTCNDTCSFEEFNLTLNDKQCRSVACPTLKIILDDSKYACISSTTELASFSPTNTFIWNETSTKVYEKVTECDYTGSIHGLVCTADSTEPVCDSP